MDPRAALFDDLRAHAPGKRIPAADVAVIDALADRWGIPRVSEGATSLRTSQRGIDLIHSFESLHRVLPDGRIAAYPDPGPTGLPWTIGWGSTGPGIGRDTIWTREQADARFVSDLAKFEKGVADALDGAPATQSQFDALVSLAYNIGLANLKSSTLLRKHKAGDYAGAQAEFAKWRLAKGKVLNGLVRRRAAEAALYGDAS